MPNWALASKGRVGPRRDMQTSMCHTHMCQTLKITHTLFLLPNRAFPGVRAYAISGHAGTA